MLRIEEIVGAMDDEFRYALDALDDQRLAVLASDRAALRRLRPVGVSHKEAMAMIATIQLKRQSLRQRQAEKPRRRAPRKAPARAKTAAPRPTAPLALPGAAIPLRLAAPMPHGPAIRLPPPRLLSPAIILPPPATFAADPPSLPAPKIWTCLAAPAAHGPAIRLPPPVTAAATIIILPPPAMPMRNTTPVPEHSPQTWPQALWQGPAWLWRILRKAGLMPRVAVSKDNSEHCRA